MYSNTQKTTLPAPKEGEWIEVYLERIGFPWVKLFDASDVLCLHDLFDNNASVEENHKTIGISPALAEEILHTCRVLTEDSQAAVHDHDLIQTVMVEEYGISLEEPFVETAE